jgi:outer membrane protein insertion porin family
MVPRTEMDFTPNGKGMKLRIHVNEGPVYTVSDMQVAGNVVFDNDEVVALVETLPGEIHNKGQVSADAGLVQQGYQDSGYVNARVIPQVVLDREAKTTAVVHRIDEGDLKYLREVTVTGNETTKDEILRRDITLIPGERYDGAELEATRRNLENTRFFDKVRLSLEDDPDNDLFTNLLVDVDEGKTGTWNFGAGFNSETGIGGFTEVRLNNFDIGNWRTFSGAGQQLRARIAIGTQEDAYSLSFTEPEFLGYPFSFGFDLYSENREYRGGTNYTQDITGGQLRIGKILSPYLSTRGGISVENTRLEDFVEYERLAHPDLREQEGSTLTISGNWSIERNTLDRFMDPTKGSRHTLSTQLAGFGGDNYFWKAEQDSLWYWPLSENRKWILSYQGRVAFVTPYGPSDNVPIQDRLYVGGTNTVRGYEQRDIGPQEREYQFLGFKFGDKFRQGGNFRVISNLEVKYKVTDIFRVYGFWDAGGVWEYFKDMEPDDLKHGVGIGIGFDVPRFGPVRLDYGFPINPDGDQGSGQLHFSSGFRF